MPDPGYNPGDPPGWMFLLFGTIAVLILLLVLKSCL
jgi:hypothetical protein